MTISHSRYYCDLCKMEIPDYWSIHEMKLDNRKDAHGRVRLYLDICQTCFYELVDRYKKGGEQDAKN